MAYADPNDFSGPMGELNTTPLIDVLLVLLVMFIITIPVATHEVSMDLPGGGETIPPFSLVANKIVIDSNDRLYWNGEPVSQGQLTPLLAKTRLLKVEPELQFEPSANASYDISVKTLGIIKSSGVTNFGFVGNSKYRDLN